MFDISLLNNLFLSFLNLFIYLSELKNVSRVYTDLYINRLYIIS